MTDSPSFGVTAAAPAASQERRALRHFRRTVFALIRVLERWAAAFLRLAGMVFALAIALARGVLTAAACVAAGVAVGMLTVGFFALEQPAQWDMAVLRHVGPPLAPILIGGGVALLTAEILLVAQFRRGRAPAQRAR